MLLAALAPQVLARRQNGVAASDAAKADYLYLESLRAKSQDSIDDAFHLLERAHSLNPADKEINLELAAYLINFDDSLSKNRGTDLMLDYYLSNPSDFQSGVRIGILLGRLGRSEEALRVWSLLHTFHPARIEVTNMLAQSLLNSGTKEGQTRALAILDTIEMTEGPSVTISSAKVGVYYHRNDTAAILGEVDRLCSLRPTSSEFHVFAGDAYSMFGDKNRALQLYDRAVELDPTSGYAYFSKAKHYWSLGDTATYDREIRNALKQTGFDVDTKLRILRAYIADAQEDSTRRPEVRALFDTLQLQHPLEHDIHSLYAAWLIEEHDYPAAIEQQEQALGLDPHDPAGWDMLSSLYVQTDDYTRAEEAVNRAIHYEPDEPSLRMKLGSLYTLRKEYRKGIRMYEEALERFDSLDNVSRSEAYTSIADNLYQLGEADSAFTLYERAIKLNPDNLMALNNSAYFMACRGENLDLALAMIERVLASDPDNPTDLDTYAWVLFKRKDYAKAREVIDRTIELLPSGSSDVYEHAGDIYFMDGEPTRAVEFWQQALELDPDNQLLRRKVRDKTFYYE